MGVLTQIQIAGVDYDIQDANALEYMGTLGSGGTIASLPAAAEANKNYVYKVVTAGTYDSKDAEIDDWFVSDGTAWTLIKSKDTRYSLASGDANGQIKVTPSEGTAYNVDVTGLNNSAYKNYTTSVTDQSTDLVTSGAVYTAIANLPKPMVFKGTLGVNGTITTLPTATTANEGYTYIVITAGTYAGQTARVGDIFVSTGTEWALVPAGDDPDDTWRSIKVNGVEVLGSNISSGALDYIDGTNSEVVFDATNKTIQINVKGLDTTTVGSASAGTAIPADDITAWTANTPTAVTMPQFSVNGDTLNIVNGSVTPGTAASLSYTAKSIPNISVTDKTVVTGFAST